MIILIGESGAGKTVTERELCKGRFKRVISHTTRSMREGEQNGVDYYFISVDEYNSLLEEGKFAEHTEYNGNFYGVHEDNITPNAVAVVEPHGMEQLKEKYKSDVICIYLKASEELRRKRMLERGDSEESVNNRIELDRTHFLGVEDAADLVIEITEDKTVKNVANEIKKFLDVKEEQYRRSLECKSFLLFLALMFIVFGIAAWSSNHTVSHYTVTQGYNLEDSTVEEAKVSDTRVHLSEFDICDLVSNEIIRTRGVKLSSGYYYINCENGATIFTYNDENKRYDYSYFVVADRVSEVKDIVNLHTEDVGIIVYLPKGGMLQTLGTADVTFSKSADKLKAVIEEQVN